MRRGATAANRATTLSVPRAVAMAGALVLALGRPAVADPGSLVLAPGELEARLAIEVGLARRSAGSPLAIAPDAWYGVAPRWTVGVIHSDLAIDRFAADASLCVRGCDHVYRGSGLDARWSWLRGPLAVAPRARVLVRDVDPWKPAATMGVLARWTRGRFAITGDPYLRIGLANRGLGNRAALVLPLWLALRPTCNLQVAVRTGWDGELATLRDGWHIPLGVAVEVRVSAQLALALDAGFPTLLGPQNNFNERVLAISIAHRR